MATIYTLRRCEGNRRAWCAMAGQVMAGTGLDLGDLIERVWERDREAQFALEITAEDEAAALAARRDDERRKLRQEIDRDTERVAIARRNLARLAD